MGHTLPVASSVVHLIHCYKRSLETSISSWTVCLPICRIVVRVWEGFPPGPALTDRNMAFQPSHWAPLLPLLLAGHHRPHSGCRNSLALYWWGEMWVWIQIFISPVLLRFNPELRPGQVGTNPGRRKFMQSKPKLSVRVWVGQASVVLYATAHSIV